MSECIGYCEEKIGPLYQHPEYSGDKLCGECLLSYWDEDLDRYLGEMVASITETGLELEVVTQMRKAGFIA